MGGRCGRGISSGAMGDAAGTQGGRDRFPGWDPTVSSLIAQVEMTEVPELGMGHDAIGVHAFNRLEYEIRDGKVEYKDIGPIGVMVTERHVGATGKPTLRGLSEALVAVYGTD